MSCVPSQPLVLLIVDLRLRKQQRKPDGVSKKGLDVIQIERGIEGLGAPQ
jgi:hypothetical protein